MHVVCGAGYRHIAASSCGQHYFLQLPHSSKKCEDGRARNYPEGITEETKTEPNRTIEKTVIKREGLTTVFQKITYTWGAIYYFKNETSISESVYGLEMKKQKEYFNK